MSRLGIYYKSGHLGLVWDGLYSQAELWDDCWGIPFRGDAGLYRFAPVCSNKLAFYALDSIMGETGLLLAGWDGRTGWDGVGWSDQH